MMPPPRCLPNDASSLMPSPRCLLPVPPSPLRFRHGTQRGSETEMGVCTFFMLENDEGNHCKMWSESMPKLINVRGRFYKKIRCAQSVRSHVVFSLFFRFLECLTFDPLAPAQSKHSFSILELPSETCNCAIPFRDILEASGQHLPRLKDM